MILKKSFPLNGAMKAIVFSSVLVHEEGVLILMSSVYAILPQKHYR